MNTYQLRQVIFDLCEFLILISDTFLLLIYLYLNKYDGM